MTPENKSLVQTSFAKVLPIADQAATLFYARLFDLDPSLRSLFTNDMAEQRRKLMKALTLTVNSLDRLADFAPIIQQMGERHATYGVKEHHYATVASALLWTLEQGLGNDFTFEVRQAWIEVYTILATLMQDAARNSTGEATQAFLPA